MPDEFNSEEKKMLAESPADSATFVGDGDGAADDERGATTRNTDTGAEAAPGTDAHSPNARG